MIISFGQPTHRSSGADFGWLATLQKIANFISIKANDFIAWIFYKHI